MADTGEAKPSDPRALDKRFYELLALANKNGAKPADVKAFKEHLQECERAGAAPWRNADIMPLMIAAENFALAQAEKLLMGAIPELWRRQAADLRAALGYGGASELERMLIAHLSLCWLRLTYMEVRYSAATDAGNSLAVVGHMERRLSAAQRRYTRACEALARVRRMKLPAVQVNIAAEGGRQLNVAG